MREYVSENYDYKNCKKMGIRKIISFEVTQGLAGFVLLGRETGQKIPLDDGVQFQKNFNVDDIRVIW